MRAMSLRGLQPSQKRSVTSDAALGHGDVIGVEFDQDGIALETIGDESGGAGAAERIEHGSARRAAGLDARLDQLGREGGEVGFREGRGGDGPDRALVATIRHDGHCFVKAAVVLRTYPRFGKLSRLSLLAALPMI